MQIDDVVSRTLLEPRPYQRRIVNKVVDMFQGRYRRGNGALQPASHSVMIESPTGSGKTSMALLACKLLQQELPDLVIGWVAMRKNLLAQAAGENASKRINVNDIHFVSMFDRNPVSLLKAKQDGRDILLVVDEAQHDAASSMAHLHNTIEPRFILGMTATPFRTDRVKLCFDSVVKDCGIHQLIQDGFLSKYHHYTIPNWNVQTVAETYVREPKRWGKSIFYFVNLERCFELAGLLRRHGVACDVVTGDTDVESQLEAFRNGEVPALINCMKLTEGFDCLSEDTEIMTPTGWVGHGDVKAGDLMYALNRATGQLEIVPIDDVAKRELRPGEQMVHFQSQHLDILVTEGHELHVKYRDPKRGGSLSNNFLTKTAGELVFRRSSYAIPLAAELSDGFPGVPLTDDELRLLGWAMTDSTIGHTTLSLHQSENPTKHAARIRALLVRLGLDFTERLRPPDAGFPSVWGCYEFNIPAGTSRAKPRAGWLNRIGEFIDRQKSGIPRALRLMTREQFLVLWEELLLANGSRTGNKAGWCWLFNKSMADTLQLLAIERGLTSMVTTEQTPSGKPIWRVTVRDRQWLTTNPTDDRSSSVHFSTGSGLVWCVKNTHSTLICRRNGKVAIVGNCPDLQTAFVRDSGKGCTMQMSGRVFRKFNGIAAKQVVQSKGTHWPIIRTAMPEQQYVWQEDDWYSLTVNPKLNQINQNARVAIAMTEVELPKFLQKKGRPKKLRF